MERLDSDLLPKETFTKVLFGWSAEKDDNGVLWNLLARIGNLARLQRVVARILRWGSVDKLRTLR